MTQARRVGIGFDVHRLVRGRPLILGGLEIESSLGLEGHSDGDVLLHAVTDALLGACGESDIGDFFPANDPKWKGASSETFLRKAMSSMKKSKLMLSNVDSIIVAERPYLGAWKEAIRSSLAGLLNLPVDRVCVKAKTNEGLGPVGEGKAIEAHAVVLLVPAKAKAAAKK
jgi:2-C-methyl-D-erythritol 2,4-cyclodiphosphate synthase